MGQKVMRGRRDSDMEVVTLTYRGAQYHHTNAVQLKLENVTYLCYGQL